MIYQPKDIVVDSQHMGKPLLLLFHGLLEGREHTSGGLNDMFCD
jgi:hypothetical protein